MRISRKKRHIVSYRNKIIESETELVKKIFYWMFQAKFTMLLVIANIFIYIWSTTLSEEAFNSLIFRPESLLALNLTQIIASWFLHANYAHLIGNVLFLFVFGRVVERRFGTIKYILIFFGAAIISDVVAGLIFQQGGIGASGAIAGLIAAAIIIDPFYLNYTLFGIPLPIVVIGWIAIFTDILGIIQPVTDNIGHIAHLAGFFGITILTFAFSKRNEKIKRGLFINILTVILALAAYYFIPSFQIIEPIVK